MVERLSSMRLPCLVCEHFSATAVLEYLDKVHLYNKLLLSAVAPLEVEWSSMKSRNILVKYM